MIKIVPSPDLSDVVEFFWLLELNGSSPLVLPDTSTNLVFNLGSAHKLINSRTGKPNAVVSDQHIIGPKMSAVRIVGIGKTRVFGVRFRLGGFSVFSSMPLRKIFESALSCDQVFRDRFFGTEFLASDEALKDKVGMIESWLRRNRRFDPWQGTASNEAKSIANTIIVNRGNIEIKRAAKDLRISLRSIQDKFQNEIGLRPKQFARIIRLNNAVKKIGDANSLTDLGLEANYYDQSHFIREFKDFTGLTPKEYASSKSLLIA